MIVPVIHLNGSGRENLTRDLCDAREAVAMAHAALAKCAPHMRDYYVLGDDADEIYSAARAEHVARMQALSTVASDLEKMAAAVITQSALEG
jgi:hypothetical protein